MMGIVAITFLSLVLIIRQGFTVFPVALKSNIHEILEEVNIICTIPGPGWIDNGDYNELKAITPGIQVDPGKRQSSRTAIVQEHFRFSFHFHPNPLLRDRPPPNKMHELT